MSILSRPVIISSVILSFFALILLKKRFKPTVRAFPLSAPKTDLLHTGHKKGGKLVIVISGLPGRGKSFYARKIKQYLSWINYNTKAFSLNEYEIMNEQSSSKTPLSPTSNPENGSVESDKRQTQFNEILERMITFLNGDGEVGILHGITRTSEERMKISNTIKQQDGFQVLWIELICSDEFAQKRIELIESEFPSYRRPENLHTRVEKSMKIYEELKREEGSVIKIYNHGESLEIFNIHGFLLTKIVSFITNLHTLPRPIFLTTSGETSLGRIGVMGGDSSLGESGIAFAHNLKKYIAEHPQEFYGNGFSVWCSTMKRDKMTADIICPNQYIEWRALREIDLGLFDSLTVQQVIEKYPEEYKNLQLNSFDFCFPHGEGFVDVMARLEPIIFELERQRQPVLIIAGTAPLRCLYAYFSDLPISSIPTIEIEPNIVNKIESKPGKCKLKRILIGATPTPVTISSNNNEKETN